MTGKVASAPSEAKTTLDILNENVSQGSILKGGGRIDEVWVPVEKYQQQEQVHIEEHIILAKNFSELLAKKRKKIERLEAENNQLKEGIEGWRGLGELAEKRSAELFNRIWKTQKILNDFDKIDFSSDEIGTQLVIGDFIKRLRVALHPAPEKDFSFGKENPWQKKTVYGCPKERKET